MEIELVTEAQKKRWKAEADIVAELNHVPSSREMQKLLKEKYGIVANHNTINKDLKLDLESLTEEEYTNQKAGIIKMVDDELEIAHNIATSDPDNQVKLKAMNTVSKLSKTKTEILNKFRIANAQIAKEEEATINLFIGQPKEIDMKKFKKLEGAVKDEEEDS